MFIIEREMNRIYRHDKYRFGSIPSECGTELIGGFFFIPESVCSAGRGVYGVRMSKFHGFIACAGRQSVMEVRGSLERT